VKRAMTTDFFKNQTFRYPDFDTLSSGTRFAFSVDVEEWFQVGAFENTFTRDQWPGLESRVEYQTEMVLALLDELGIKATFFTLGWVGERFPAAISAVAAQGHELACHGMDHRRLFQMTRAEFAADIIKTKQILEQISGSEVRGYRAPSFSLTPETWWSYDELVNAGFSYSSSLYPVKTDHYGSGTAPRRPFFPVQNEGILEIPMTVCDTPIKRMPASGGGYFRLLPYQASKYMIRKGAFQSKAPAVFYMHPWELDTGQPYVKNAPLISRFRHYSGQSGLPKKLRRLANDFSWGRIDAVFGPILPAAKGAS